MKYQEKRFVTRQYWLNGRCHVWNIWDKKECKWYSPYGYFTRESALMDADKLNKEKHS